jgi:hypothetical protein
MKLALLILLLLTVIVYEGYRLWKRRHDYAVLKAMVHATTDAYAFLIDRKFHVKETNFYELNENIADDQPYVLGNVIHCQTACDEGLCGTGMACKECPIRLVLKNAFKLKRDFSDIVAGMSFYDADHQLQETDVNVSGRLVHVGKEPHFFITVRTSTAAADPDPSAMTL